MRGVFEDVVRPLQTPYPLDVLDGRECDTDDALGDFRHPLQCLPVEHCAVPIPGCDTAGQDALNGAAVKVHQNLRREVI